MPDAIVIRPERPDQPEVVALLASLDSYLAALYPPEANHILGVQELLAPEVSFYVARAGRAIVGTGACRRMPAEPATGGQPTAKSSACTSTRPRAGSAWGARLLAALEERCAAKAPAGPAGDRRSAVEAVRLYRRAGYVARPAFGGYPDNGLSVFYGKAL
jgi:putative acetyltransferase